MMRIIWLLILLAGTVECQPQTSPDDSVLQRVYYAIEIQGNLCGYSELSESSSARPEGMIHRQEGHTEISMTIMDRSIQTIVDVYCDLMPDDGRVTESGIDLEQGNVRIKGLTRNNGSVAVQENLLDPGDTTSIDLPDGTLIENLMYKRHLVEDFIGGEISKKTYAVLSELKGEVIEKTYQFKGYDTLFLAGEDRPALSFTEIVLAHGSHCDLWISPLNGLIMRVYVINQERDMYLSDERVKDLIGQANLDDLLFYKVGHVIKEFRNLEFMELDVDIYSIGSNITVEGLNQPGQNFSGSVIDNHIVGTFILEPVRLTFEDPPAFPVELDNPDEFIEYLEPGDFIESDDEEIVEMAQRIVKGAPNALEAVRSLSRWIDMNIKGALPGGGTAKGTLDMREAECGGHSRLMAAFCRAVGIPARVVAGCMYVPSHGGFFGQHAWTEVYLGEYGWMPLDATIGEIDYIDAGHIRLGEQVSFHPRSMEIINYQLAHNESPDQ